MDQIIYDVRKCHECHENQTVSAWLDGKTDFMTFYEYVLFSS